MRRLKASKSTQRHIRSVVPADAEQILDLYCSIVEEEVFFATCIQDRCRSIEEQQLFIHKAITQHNCAAWVYCQEDVIVGSLFILGGDLIRTSHLGELEIQVDKEHRRLGIGRALLHTALESMRRNPMIHKVQLSVLPDNISAINLYKQLGFEQEGEIKGALKESTGQYRSELIMGLWV